MARRCRFLTARPSQDGAPDTLVDFHTGVDYALSREQKNKKGGKMYIQDKVEEYADEIFERLENGAVMYFCGLKGMMPGIQDARRRVRPRLTSLRPRNPVRAMASPVDFFADAQGSVPEEGQDVRRLRRRPEEEGPVARRGLLSVAFRPRARR